MYKVRYALLVLIAFLIAACDSPGALVPSLKMIAPTLPSDVCYLSGAVAAL